MIRKGFQIMLGVLVLAVIAVALTPNAGAASLRLLPDRPASREAGAADVLPSGDYERFLVHDDLKRRYEVHVPPAYDGKTPVPVVLNYHGGGGNIDAARRGTKMDAKSDSAGFIVVYPQGTGRFERRILTFNGGRCCGLAARNGVDDVGFTAAILDDLPRYFRIDTRRIYATGLSNGGIMSHRIACEVADRIAAIAAVAGPLEFLRCRPSRPVPVMHIHGTKDNNAPYEGGVGSRSISRTRFRSVAQTIRRWLVLNRCPLEPASKIRKGPAIIETYKPEPGGAEVVLVTVEDGGHVWPGGKNILPRFLVGKDVGGLDANELIWQFFSRHQLP